MSLTPARSYTRLAIAIVIAAVVISASILSYSSFELTVTRTGTTETTTATTTLTVVDISTSATTVTSTQTTTCIEGAVASSTSEEPGTSNLAASVIPSNSTNNCQLGVTLGVAANPTVSAGQNETVYLSLSNDFAMPNDVNYTGPPVLPHGFVVLNSDAFDYVLPLLPTCGYPFTSSYEPASMVVYNATGSPMQLSDSPPEVLNCLSTGQNSHPFNASQTLTEALSIGGYWTSTDASEPWINATYSQFGPGNYTAVAFDPWGQLAELNFTVSGLPAGGVYKVTFQQIPCAGDYAVPWSATLGNKIAVMPAGVTVPGPGRAELQADPNASTIVFSVAPGSYAFSVSPAAGFLHPDNTTGTISVTSANVIVQLAAECHP